ncbi:MAG: response regulator transcription factor [Anaerolineae bacterium]|jgi:DNA-binding response OmpR family regulator
MTEKGAIKILAIDDAQEMTYFLRDVLRKEGYQVAVANDAREGLRLAHSFRPDLILLDVMMPDMDGWTMLNRLREFSDIPVIMLTAVGSTDSKVHGLDLGADDYLTKPFEIRELKARIRATLRRATLPATDGDQILLFDGGRLVIDPASYQVSSQGQEVDLTPIEHKLLLYLAINAGRVLTYEQILNNVWGPGYEDSLTNLKVYVRRLRTKIEADPSDPQYILTQWGVGYRMAKL